MSAAECEVLAGAMRLVVSFSAEPLVEAAPAARLGLHPSLQPLLGKQAAMEPFSKRVGTAVKRPGRTIKETRRIW